MKLIVGLGNPGKTYHDTRHNVGFAAIDTLAEKLDISVTKARFQGLFGQGRYAGEAVILLKPVTYMNLSGQSVAELMKFYKIEPTDVLVLHDDVDIPAGTIRLRAKGGPGTHNGMKSVVKSLGIEAFHRIKIGVGQAPPQWDLADFVLSKLTEDDRKDVDDAVKQAVDASLCWLKDGIDVAMNRYNVRTQKER